MMVIDFIANNWVNILLVLVGTFALVIYILQERRKKIDAASLIILQIDELQERLREISGYIVNAQLNFGAFYESLPLMERNYWNDYKHYFVQNMDATSYNALNQFYSYVSEVQEQQILLKSLQKNHFYMLQSALINIESQFISNEMSGPQFDINNIFQRKSKLESIINQNALTAYTPTQIQISIDAILKKYSMLSIVGSDGYRLLKTWSAKKR